MQIDITITEILSRIITVDALSTDDAIIVVENMYKNEDIVLDYSDFNGYAIIEMKEDNFKQTPVYPHNPVGRVLSSL